MFDTAPTTGLYTSRSNPAGGQAYFVPRSVPNAVDLLLPDLRVAIWKSWRDPPDHLYFLHKKKDGVRLFLGRQ